MTTPDHARDKIALVQEQTPVHTRVANVLEAAIGTIMARFCYTRQEAMAAMRSYSGCAPRAAPKRRHSA